MDCSLLCSRRGVKLYPLAVYPHSGNFQPGKLILTTNHFQFLCKKLSLLFTMLMVILKFSLKSPGIIIFICNSIYNRNHFWRLQCIYSTQCLMYIMCFMYIYPSIVLRSRYRYSHIICIKDKPQRS